MIISNTDRTRGKMRLQFFSTDSLVNPLKEADLMMVKTNHSRIIIPDEI
jgi:hypothetical protein